MKIPYAKWSIEWSVVLRDDRIVDLIPRPGGLPDGDESPYASYELAACFPSLCGGGGATAATVAGEASEAFHGRQTAKAAEAGGRLAADVAACRAAAAPATSADTSAVEAAACQSEQKAERSHSCSAKLPNQ